MKRGLTVPLLLLLSLPLHAAQTTVFSAPADLEGAAFERTRVAPLENGLIELAPGASSGSVVLPAFAAPEFDSLVASWNAETPPGTAVEVWGQIFLFNTWTDWFQFGRWSAAGGETFEKTTDTAYMDVDTLRVLANDVKGRQVRLKAVLTGSGKSTPVLRQLAAAVASETAPPPDEPAFTAGPWVRDLDVPTRSQMTEQADFARDICSPTSLSMAAAFWSKDRATRDVALAVRDRRTQRFGVWPFNTAVAGDLGLRAHVARMNRLADLQSEIAQGRPIVVSIGFEDSLIKASPLKRTKGHLLVVRGFTASGDVIVNDPAAPGADSARRVYDRAQFRKAWLENKRGLAYVIKPLWPYTLALGRQRADLRAEPKAGDAPGDRGRLTQLITGETVTISGARDGWARAEAVEQQHSSSGTWSGYRGWIETAALGTPSPAFQPNAVVSSTMAALPLGSRLMVLNRSGAPLAGEDSGSFAVRLYNGFQSGFSRSAVNLLPIKGSKAQRAEIVRTAGLFLGRPYVWGGLDCSGLTSLAFRTAGIDLPRDSHDQFLKALQLERAAQPGDLFFLSRPDHPEAINHVGIYAGGDELIESIEATGVHRTTFAQRFGRPLSKLKAGDKVGERTIWFGTIGPP